MSSNEVKVEATPDTTSKAIEMSGRTTARENINTNDPTPYPSGLKLVTVLACVYGTVFLVSLV
jgi:hypothetical protein